MAKTQDYITKEATRIGYKKMLEDLEKMLETELSESMRAALTDQQTKLRELLEAL